MNIQAPHSKLTKANRLSVIDCDVHPRMRDIAMLKPYMSARWWDYLQTYGLRKRHGFVKGHPYPKSQPADGQRRDAWPPEGGQPGTSLPFLREQLLDAYGIDFGILNPLSPTGQGDQNPELSAAVAAANNMWQLADWVDKEPRLKASIVVPYENPEAAVAEIRKHAGDRRFAHVLLMSRTNEALGRKRYWPIFEAAVEAGLPVGIHVFGFSGYASTNTGSCSYYIEEMTEHETSCSALIASMIMEGLFERFPTLKIVLIESGFAWLPALGWRLDKTWNRMRAEVPHVRRPPSEYMRANIWTTTQPMEEPENPQHLKDIIDWIGWDKLMFASDYAHWDFDDPFIAIPASFGDERRMNILSGTARALYGFA